MLITCENIPGQNIIDAISGVDLACTKYLVELVLFYVNFYKANIIELFIPLRELYIFLSVQCCSPLSYPPPSSTHSPPRIPVPRSLWYVHLSSLLSHLWVFWFLPECADIGYMLRSDTQFDSFKAWLIHLTLSPL